MWLGIKFGSLAIILRDHQYSYSHKIHVGMVIPYLTVNFKSTNIFKKAIGDPTARLNSHQYFRLYGNVLQ